MLITNLKNKIVLFLKNNWLLLLIVFLGTTIRFYHIPIRGDLWFDEWFSIHFSTLPSWGQTLKYWLMETNPPLYTLILKMFIPIIGGAKNILGLRILSIGLSAISTILIFKLGKKFFNKQVGILATFLFSISGLMIILNTEIRVYSLLFLLACSSLYFYHGLIIEKQNNKTSKIGLFFSNLLLLFSHLTAPAVLIIQSLGIILFKINRQLKISFFKINSLVLAIWLPWIIASFFQKEGGSVIHAWYFKSGINFFKSLIYPLVVGLSGIQTKILLIPFIILLLIGLVFLIFNLKKEKQEDKVKIVFLLLWLFFPILSSTLVNVYIPKYYSAFYPALFILFGLIFYKLINYKKIWGTIYFLATLLCIVWGSFTVLHMGYTKWNFFINEIKTGKTDNSIIIMPFNETELFKKYYEGNLKIVGVYFMEENLPIEEKILKYNYTKQIVSDEETNNWIDNKVMENKKIFLLEYNQAFKPLREALEKKNWELIKTKEMPGLTNYRIHTLIKHDN